MALVSSGGRRCGAHCRVRNRVGLRAAECRAIVGADGHCRGERNGDSGTRSLGFIYADAVRFLLSVQLGRCAVRVAGSRPVAGILAAGGAGSVAVGFIYANAVPQSIAAGNVGFAVSFRAARQ